MDQKTDSAVTAAELDEFNAAYTRQCAPDDIEICANGGPCGCAQAAFLSASATLRRERDGYKLALVVATEDNAKKDAALRKALLSLETSTRMKHPEWDRSAAAESVIGKIRAALAPAAQGETDHIADAGEMVAPAPSAGETVLVPRDVIRLTPAEIQSGHDRVRWAEGLILQLPNTHDGRNSWLLNYGLSAEADACRKRWTDRNGPLPASSTSALAAAPTTGERRVCENCGSTENIDSLTRQGYVACCPERKMVAAPTTGETP
jgi:hypothetical protein